MSTNLFGEKYMSNPDYAKKIIQEGFKKPFWKIEYYPENEGIDNSKVFDIKDENGDVVTLSHYGGMYVIYRKIGDTLECHYAGQSYTNLRRRLFRYMVELAGYPGASGGHSGAKKAREDGVRPTDELLIKILSNDEISKIFEKYGDDFWHKDTSIIDEYIAKDLKAKYNSRVR